MVMCYGKTKERWETDRKKKKRKREGRAEINMNRVSKIEKR